MDKKLEFLYAKSKISPLWYDKGFESFTNDPVALDKVKSYVQNISKKTVFGLAFHGKQGVGKSHLMMNVAKVTIDLGYDTKVITLSDLMNAITATFGKPALKKELLSTLRQPMFLFIESVGREFRSDLASKALSFIVEDRILIKRPLFFASTLLPKEFKGEYGEDVSSLLKEKCLPVYVKGEDFRDRIFDSNNEDLNG